MYVGKISSVMEDNLVSKVMEMGDFNVCLGDRYFCEWMKICEDYNLTFSDVDALTESSFTHINCGTLSRSWLDHVLSSSTVNASI